MTAEGRPSFIVVHIATGPHELELVEEDLKAYGLTVVRLDNPTSNAVSRMIGEYRVRIAVPEGEVAAAKTVIAEHIARGVPGSVRYARALRRQFALTVAVMLGTGVVVSPFIDRLENTAWVAGLAAAAFFLISGWIPPLKRWFEGDSRPPGG